MKIALLAAVLLLPMPMVFAGPDAVVLDGDTTTNVPGDHATPWSFNDTLTVGKTNSSHTVLNLTSGTIQDLTTFIGDAAGSEGTITVTGPTALFDNKLGAMFAGHSGTGTLTVANGGTVKVGGTLTIANLAGSTGTLNIGEYDLTSPTTAGSLQATSVKFGAGTGVINFNQTDAITLAASITGSGNVFLRGTGSTTFSGTNTYDGVTTISDGTVKFATRDSLASGNWTAEKLIIGGGVIAKFAVGGTNGFTADDLDIITALGTDTGGFQAAAALGIDTGAATTNFTYGTGIADPNFGANVIRFAVFGAGTLSLTGASTYTGGTFVEGGTLAVNGGSISSAGSNLVVGEVAGADAALRISNAGSVTVNSSSIGSTDSTGTVTVTGAGSSWTSADAVIGESGTGALTLENGGAASIGGGFLDGLIVAKQAGSSGTLNIGSPDLAHPTTAGVLNASKVKFGAGTGVVNFNQTDAITFSVPITGAGSVLQRGSGITTLAGANSYTGATTVSAGTLAFTGPQALYAGDSAQWTPEHIIVGNDATLALPVGGAGEFSTTDLDVLTNLASATGGFQSGSTLRLDTSNAIGEFLHGSNISGSFGLAKTGAGTLTLAGANSYAGTTTVAEGTLSFATRTALYNADTAKWTATKLVVNSGATAAFHMGGADEFTGSDLGLLAGLGFQSGSFLAIDVSNAPGSALTISSDSTAAITLTKVGAGVLTFTGTNSFSGGASIREGALVVDGGGVSLPSADFIVGDLAGSTATAAAQNGGTIGGRDIVIGKLGDGTLNIENSAIVSASGNVTVAKEAGSKGTLHLGSYDLDHPTTAGTLQAATLAFGDGTGVVNFNQPGATTFSTSMSGAGGVVQRGAGTTTLTGTNTLTGITTIESGTMIFATRDSLSHGNAPTWAASNFSVKYGATAVLNVGGANEFTAADLDAIVNLGDFDAGFQFGSILALDTTNATGGVFTTAANISDSLGFLGRSFVKLGAGTLKLTGTNTYSFGTTIAAGTLNVNIGSISHPDADMDLEAGTLKIENAGSVASLHGITHGAATVTGVGSKWTMGSDLTVESSIADAATLTVSNNATVASQTGQIANAVGTTGSVTVTGSGSKWSVGGPLYVGAGGSGTLDVLSAARVESQSNAYLGRDSGSEGTVTVDDTASWTHSGTLTIGSSGKGTLTISGFGSVSAATAVIGDASGSEGTVTVTGASSWTNSGALTIGSFGKGTLNILAQGVVSDTTATVGLTNHGSSVTVSGSNSKWTNSGNLTLQFATMDILDGGAVSSVNGRLVKSTVTVSGPLSSWTNTGALTVGDNASAGSSLSILAGAQVSNTLGSIGHNTSHSSVIVSGSPSTWTNSSNLAIGDGDSVTDISLDILDHGTVNDASATVAAGSYSQAAVTVSGGGSRWLHTADLTIGANSFTHATLDIADGAIVTDVNGLIATDTGSVGSVSVRGSGSQWTNSGNLTLGNGIASDATLTLESGSAVSVTGAVTLGNAAGSTVTVNIGAYDLSHPTTAGQLQADSLSFGSVPGGTVNFNQTNDISFSPSISGTFDLVQRGSGTTSIGNVIAPVSSSGTSGKVRVEAGTLLSTAPHSFFNGNTAKWTSANYTVSAGATLAFSAGNTGLYSAADLDLFISPVHSGFFDGSFLGIDTTYSSAGEFTYGSNITAGFGIAKLGTGTLTLTGNSTYTGGTLVLAGTLIPGSVNALGTGAVVVKGGTLQLQAGITIPNTITLAGGTLAQQIGAGTSLASLGDFKGDVTGGTITTGAILGGTTSTPASLQSSFAAFSPATNDNTRLSDVFNLSGVPVVDPLTGATDIFVLQLQIANVTPTSYLGWFNPATMQWVNAVDGNFGGVGSSVGNRAYNSATDFHLGTYGVNTSAGTVWAVLNHNSDFAINLVAIPEPHDYGIALAALLGGIVLLRRRHL
ncbi:MAG: beta strand repeat-containing protein [Chthoniobacterales bacterium]